MKTGPPGASARATAPGSGEGGRPLPGPGALRAPPQLPVAQHGHDSSLRPTPAVLLAPPQASPYCSGTIPASLAGPASTPQQSTASDGPARGTARNVARRRVQGSSPPRRGSRPRFRPSRGVGRVMGAGADSMAPLPPARGSVGWWQVRKHRPGRLPAGGPSTLSNARCLHAGPSRSADGLWCLPCPPAEGSSQGQGMVQDPSPNVESGF